ncbi:MAG TPA: alpha-L-fucosidase [Candidatus Acidoferrales bacterium]|nr:alpha-L-fucosidase [Candidatus Acidoferrales bacterium]
MRIRRPWRSKHVAAAILAAGGCVLLGAARGQAPAKYEATLESLDRHPLPRWYADAKLGIFIHWGLYSVPGWAVLAPPGEKLSAQEYLKRNPYAEWYLNTLRLEGSPTQAYHKEHYGAGYDYYNFAETFDREIQKWKPDVWARVFREAGAKYVVLTSKHHEGFTLWPTEMPNPTLPANRQHATRDLVGELTAAVNKQGLRMGLYYSGGYDWTFVPGPITDWKQAKTVEPQTEAYGRYVDAQMRELIGKYHPAILWNDIDYPKSGHPLEIMAEFYNRTPDGVVDDRFGVAHADFTSPEYETLDKISAKKWEECRGLGRSFGYNRAEGEAETIKKDELIYLLVDIVSKNGNLLLDVGPEADGTIPAVQMDRLRALGAWLAMNGEGIYGTRPWTRAEGVTSEGIRVRFTQKDGALYVFLLGKPKGKFITIKDLAPKQVTAMSLLGTSQPIAWRQSGSDLEVQLPADLPGSYVYTLKIERSLLMVHERN